MKWLRPIAAAATLLISAAAAAWTQGAMPDRMLLLTDRDAGRTVDVHIGETITVSLPENATTGYRWAIEDLDPALVEAREGKPTYTSQAVGSGGMAAWMFTARAPGTTQVVLKLWRPWEGDKSIAQRFSFHMRIAS
jgi:inhibitor of cysteine peptidase